MAITKDPAKMSVKELDENIEMSRKKRRVIQRDMDRIVKQYCMIKERLVQNDSILLLSDERFFSTQEALLQAEVKAVREGKTPCDTYSDLKVEELIQIWRNNWMKYRVHEVKRSKLLVIDAKW